MQDQTRKNFGSSSRPGPKHPSPTRQGVRIFRVRTYSHAVLTWAIARSAAPHDDSASAWGVSGATLPDLPAVLGAVWLVVRRRRLSRGGFNEEVCAKGPSPVRMRPFTRRSSWVTCSWPSGRALRGSTSGTSRCFRFLWDGPVMYSPTRSPTRRTRARSCGRSQKDVSRARSPTGTAHDTPAPLR